MGVIAKAVGSGTKSLGCSPGAVAAVDNGCSAVTNFGMALNELGVSLCPPQENTNISLNIDGILMSANTLFGALKTMLSYAMQASSSESSTATGSAVNDELTPLQKVEAC